jgi:HTH-type transcriptional regulator, competence development regulator
MRLGEKLRELRKASGLTLRELADKACLDYTYISKIETNKLEYMPAVDTIRKLAELLDANPLELLSLADKLPPELNQISNVPAARRFMERAQRVASPQDWEALLDVLERRHAEREGSRKGD